MSTFNFILPNAHPNARFYARKDLTKLTDEERVQYEKQKESSRKSTRKYNAKKRKEGKEADQSRPPPRKKARIGNAEAGPSSGPGMLTSQASPFDQHTHLAVPSDPNPIPAHSVPRYMDEIETTADELNDEDSGLLHPEGPEFHPPASILSSASAHTDLPPIFSPAIPQGPNHIFQYKTALTVDAGVQTMATMMNFGTQTAANMVDAGVQTTAVSRTDGSNEALPALIPPLGTLQEGSSTNSLAQDEGIVQYPNVNITLTESCEDLLVEMRFQCILDCPPLDKETSSVIKYINQGYTMLLHRQLDDRQLEIQLEIPIINLTLSAKPKPQVGPIICYDIKGEPTEYHPSIYRKEELTMLLGLRRNVEQFYIAEMPKHISDPDNSMFYIISHEDEVYMFAKKTQKILRDRHIVLMNVKSHTTAFDHRGLETLSPPNTVVNIDNQCLPRSAPLSERVRPEELKQFIDHCESTNKRILHVAHMKSDFYSRQAPYSTNFVICRETEHEPHCIEEKNIDMTILHWQDLATENAVHGWRLVPHGFGAVLEASTGKQWVIVVNAGSDSSNFLPNFESVSATNRAEIPMEAIVLHEGTKLVLRPNTLYATVALENSVLQGEYYLASHTLMSSLYGLIHSFITGSSMTFEDGIAPMFFIRRMVHYFHNSLVSNSDLDSKDPSNHLFAFEDSEDLKALFSLFGLVVFMNVLDKRTYRPYIEAGDPLSPDATAQLQEYDRNAIPYAERRHCAYTRGLARDLMTWFCGTYIINDLEDNSEVPHNLLSAFMVHIAVTMVQYKRQAVKHNKYGCCKPEAFEEQVAMSLMGVVEGDAEIDYHYQLEMLDDDDTPDLAMWYLDRITITPAETPIQLYGRDEDYMIKGTNEADRLFFQGHDCGFKTPTKASTRRPIKRKKI